MWVSDSQDGEEEQGDEEKKMIMLLFSTGEIVAQMAGRGLFGDAQVVH